MKNELPLYHQGNILSDDYQRILNDLAARNIKVDWKNGNPHVGNHDISYQFLYPTMMDVDFTKKVKS